MTRSSATILLAAGGTGGHLFPAFALAEELTRRGNRIELVTDMRGDRYGTDFPAQRVHQIPSATLAAGRSPVKIAKTGATLLRGIAKAYRLLGKVQPSAVVGFGGYPTFPPLVAAVLRGIPSALHEQNAVLGRANRVLAGRVTAVATSFQNTKHLSAKMQSKTTHTGNPVRDIVLEARKTPYVRPQVDVLVKLLVFGGSQGARFFSDSVPPALALLPEAMRANLSVVQQCREEDLPRVRQAYATHGISAQLATFFADLPQRIADSHLVIGRAGASSIAELTAIGRPSILVPLPHAIDNDQLNNAAELAESGGAWCIEQKDLTSERLSSELAALISSPERLAIAADLAHQNGQPDAVIRLADVVTEIAMAGS